MANTKKVLDANAVMFGGTMLKVVFARTGGDRLVHDPSMGRIVVNSSEKRRVRELVRRWFLAETSAYVVKKVAEFAPTMRVRPSRVDVREIGTWGYCTRGGRLSFSWQLIALPERLREYVVLHELVHLSVFNHSGEFKRRLQSVCPDFKQCEKELGAILPYDRPA